MRTKSRSIAGLSKLVTVEAVVNMIWILDCLGREWKLDHNYFTEPFINNSY